MPQPGWLDPSKLVDAAEHLAGPNAGPGRPRHAFLRRAVSTSYYALFHALSVDIAEARRALADLEAAAVRDRQGFATLAAFRSRLH